MFGLLAFFSGGTAFAQNSGGPVPLVQSPSAGATTTGGARRIVGDEGILCARAFDALPSDLPAVIRACSKIQAKQPTPADRARVLRYRGVAEQRNGDPSSAIDDLDIVIRLTPDDWRALKYRAQAHEAIGRREDAIADYQRLAALRPGDTVWRIKIAALGAVPPEPTAPPAATALAAPEPPVSAAAEPPKEPVAEAAPAPAAEDPAVQLRKLQLALRELGYDVGAVNGLLGTKTREALDAFAADIGLPRGTDPGPQFLAAAEEELAHRRAIAAAEQQDLNRRIQKALADLGYYEGDIDGAFGPMSHRALEGWLAASGRQSGVAVDQSLAQSLDAAVLAQVMLARPETKVAAAPPPSETIRPKVAEPPLIALATPTEPPPPPPPPLLPEPPLVQAPLAAPTPLVVKSAGPYELVEPKAEMPEKRVALVIGNGNYSSVTPLVNPKHDAEDVTQALADLGFEVLKGIDLSRDDMNQITKDFARKARTADIAMTYYSGHGMQFERTNYLVPIDVEIKDEYDLREMVELSQVIQDTGQAKKLALVVVDACRNDPLAQKALARSLGTSRSTSLGQGLAAPRLPPSQSLIAYATAADFVAYDGAAEARNSPFTAALLRNIKTQKLDVRQLFGKVSDEVRKATGDAQRPDMWAALGGDPIYLVPGPPEPVGLEMADLTAGEVLVVQRSLKSLKFWSGAEDGAPTPELTLAVRSWQRSQFIEQSGRLTPQQMIALNRTAARDRPRQDLPEFKLNEIVGEAFRGEVEAQRVMGMVYDPAFVEAPSFDKDRSTARTFYEMAANQGDARSAGLLGMMLVAPENPNPDRDGGMKWLEQAAMGGDANAALRMAEIVVEGQPDDAGRSKAVKFLQIAAVDPNTSGMANAWLRHIGRSPVAQ